jgi:hypothetical protein
VDLVGSKEPSVKGDYHREDCARWAMKKLHLPSKSGNLIICRNLI